MILSQTVKIMTADHSFYSTETAVLHAHGANEVDHVGTPDNVNVDV
jgi:hypothetical protein